MIKIREDVSVKNNFHFIIVDKVSEYSTSIARSLFYLIPFVYNRFPLIYNPLHTPDKIETGRERETESE